MKRFFSLKNKITFVVSLLVAVLMVALSLSVISYFEQRFRESITNQQNLLVTEIANDIDNTITRTQASIIAKAADISGQTATDPILAQQLLQKESYLQTIFDNGIYLFSPSGIMLAEYPDRKRQGTDYSYREYFAKTMESGKPYISAPFFSSKAHHHPAIMFTAPLLDANGKIIAILGGSIDLTKDNILGQHARTTIGRSGYLYIYDTDHTMIMHPERSRILKQDITKDSANGRLPNSSIGSSAAGEKENSLDAKAVVSLSRLTSTNWIVAAHYPFDEAYAPIRAALRFSILAVIAGVLVSVLTVSLSMRFLTAPLCKLTDHIRNISRGGKTEQEILIESRDEIGELATTFNSMMNNLNRHQEEMRRISHEYTMEIASALAGAQEERARSEAFIAAIADPITVVNLDFRILYQNKLAVDMMGSHVGEYYYKAYHGMESPCEECLVSEAFRDGMIHRTEKKAALPYGTRHIDFTVSPVRDSKGNIVAAIELVRDISDRKQAEWLFTSQLRLTGILVESPTVGEAIPRVLEAICEAIDWEVGGVWWVDSRKEVLRLLDMWHQPELDIEQFETINRTISFLPDEGLPGRVWVSGNPEWISNVQQDKNFPRLSVAEKYDLHGAFAFPIALGGTVVGVMEFFSRKVREPDSGLLDALAPLGSQLGLLIERKWDEQSLRESERRFRETLQTVQLLAVEIDIYNNILFCNDFLLNLTGWKKEDVIGKNWFEFFCPDTVDISQSIVKEIAEGTRSRHGEYEIVTRYKERRLISWNRTILFDSDGEVVGGASIGEDITERRRAEKELIYRSSHDLLTGLYNRAFFEEELKRLSQGRRFPVSLITIDVDGLKKINDSLGHAAGDHLIRQVARVLLKAFRTEDVVARTGGDEFAIILPESDACGADAAVERVRLCMNEANQADVDLNLSISIGTATAMEAHGIPSALKLSDERMYVEKNAKKKMLHSGAPAC